MKIIGSGRSGIIAGLTVLVAGIGSTTLHGAEPLPVSIPDAGYAVPISGEYALQYVDETAGMTAVDLWRLDSWEPAGESLSFGYTDSALWLRIRVVGPGSGNVWLTEHHGIDRLDVWEITASGPKTVGGTGWMNPDAVSGRTSARAVSTVALPSSLERVYLLRMASTSSMSPRLVLMGDSAYWRTTSLMGIIQGFSLALTAIFLVFGLVILFVYPGREIGAFVALVVSIGLMSLYITGLGPLQIWEGLPAVNMMVAMLAMPVYLVTSILFLLTHYGPAAPSWFTRVLQSLMILIIVLSAVAHLVPVGIAFRIQSLQYLTVVLALETVFVMAVIRRLLHAGHILTAWSMVLLAVAIQLSLNFGVFGGVSGIYNYGFVIVIGMAIQNSVFAAIIVISTERRRVGERLARQQAEAALEAQREQIILADRMTGLATRVSVVTHEVATPLGSTRLLGTRTVGAVDEFRTTYLKGEASKEDFEKFLDDVEETGRLVDRSLSRALEIVNGFRLIAAEEAALNSRSIDIRAFFTEFVRITEPLVKRTPHELLLEAPECRQSIRTIPGYLSQILSNLVGNALRHAFPEGQNGTIRLKVSDGTEGELIIDVRDNGRGVAADLRERIFEMHFTTAEKGGGTGLGLSVSRSLAEDRLNGSLVFLESEGGGSLFRLRLNELSDSA